jgi:nucleotide-binding universal stress UspA family protein
VTGSIICGIDDSESAKGAARVARELSAQLRRPLVFVRVVEDGSSDEKISAIAARLHDLADGATDVDCGAHWRVDVGHPADALVAAAEDEKASVIVVGSTGPHSSLLGSISADVSRRAPCPVVVVPPGAGQPLANGRSSFPGLGDHGYTGVTGRIRLERVGSDKNARRRDAEVTDGIVRFGLGGRDGN